MTRRNSRTRTSIETLEAMLLMSAGSFDFLGQGTEGSDILLALSQGQTLDGLAGNDLLFGLAGSNTLNGGDGNDLIFVLRGDNHVDGGDGHDTVFFWGIRRADVEISQLTDGRIQVTTAQGTTDISNAEDLYFKDGTVAVSDLFPPGHEYRSIDGTGNNLSNVELGSTHEQLRRISESEYADGISVPAGDDRPDARTISNELAAQHTTQLNARGLSDITWLWGQFIDHDISITPPAQGADRESFNVEVPSGDALFDPDYTGDAEIPLSRSVYDSATGDSPDNPREQVNEITAWIDGSMVYGSDQVRADALRTFEGGHLKTSDGNLLPFNDVGLANANDIHAPEDSLFLAGDVRANENAALTGMHTLWMREHNRIADTLAAAKPELSDEQIYQQSRELVIAEIQAITFNEFLPALLGSDVIPEYSGYHSDVDPTIANEFSAAGYRLGHSMLSGELQRLNNDGTLIDAGNLALRNAFFNPAEVIDHGIDSLLLGAARQQANELDNQVVDDVRNFLFGPPGSGGLDLASLNIQRGRDHGLADYNQVRADLGLTPVTSFADITSDPELQARLEDLYGSVDNIDLWVGGLAEDHVSGSNLGETFLTLISDQFIRLRDGDRFWYQNIFDGERLQQIESTTLADVIERNTGVRELQDNVFFVA
ncbi:MAG: peroxidase family protein [Planctomycetaceae bacterium]